MKKIISLIVGIGALWTQALGTPWEERFDKHIAFIKLYAPKAAVCFGNCPPHYDEQLFHNDHIRSCVQDIEHNKTLIPILQGWEIEREKNEEFLKEFGCLLAYTYDNIAYARTRVSVFDLLGLYLQISELPLPQLLDILDQMVMQLEIIMENYPLEERFTWRSWMEKYWWVPTFGSIVCLYSILKWYNNRKYR